MTFRRVCSVGVVCASLSSAFLAGCGSNNASNNSSSGSSSNAAPVLSSLSPSAATAGSPGLTLTGTGSNFVQGSEIEWNGVAIPTLYVSQTTLQASLTAAQLSAGTTVSVSVVNPASAGGATSNVLQFVISGGVSPNPSPTISSLSPSSATAGSAALSMTVTGSNFVSTSTVGWNGSALNTTYNNSNTLTAQVPASDLASSGTDVVTVVNPAPGGGTSNGANFTVNAAESAGQITVSTLANSLAWDPVNQVIYLSLPSMDGSNGNSIQILNPVTGALGASALAGSEPDLLAVSSSSQYLYVGLDGASNVQVMTLPSLGTGIVIPLGSSSNFGPYYAMDVEASPVADGTVAVVRGLPSLDPEEEGGVIIYDQGVARANPLCGFIQSGCTGTGGDLFDSIQWNSAATEMYAANNEDTGFDFYTIPVTSAGFGTVTDYPGLVGGFGSNIHYDATTGYVYDDDGVVINPSAGSIVGTFQSSGLMVPDGANGKAYFLGQTTGDAGTSTYTIQSFNINTFDPISGVTIQNVIGTPTHFIRWGSDGLAFTSASGVGTSTETGAVYILSGSLVSAPLDQAGTTPHATSENVQRTWTTRAPLVHTTNPADEIRLFAPQSN